MIHEYTLEYYDSWEDLRDMKKRWAKKAVLYPIVPWRNWRN